MDKPNFRMFAEEFYMSSINTLEELCETMFKLGRKYEFEESIRQFDKDYLEQKRLKNLIEQDKWGDVI